MPYQHQAESWHSHQPAPSAARWFPLKWDVAVRGNRSRSYPPAFLARPKEAGMTALVLLGFFPKVLLNRSKGVGFTRRPFYRSAAMGASDCPNAQNREILASRKP